MRSVRLIIGYLLLVGIPLLLLLAILRYGGPGSGVTAALSPGAQPPARQLFSGGFLLVLQILVILVASRLLGAAFRRIGQPAVIGEMVAGVALGPSFAGWVAPGFSAAVFPTASLGHLEALSQLGLVLFMFVVGASLNSSALREHCHAALLSSHVSIALPLLLGAALARLLYPDLAGRGVAFTPFALFMGAAMSITAFPILARILRERKMLHSGAGVVALASAAVDDATGWCLLAYVTVVIRAPHSGLPIWLTVAGALGFGALMIFGVRPLLTPLGKMAEDDDNADRVLVTALAIAFLSALTTEFLGIHLLFGSFLAGAVLPKTARLKVYLQERLEFFCLAVLMPLFFALTGLRTNFGALGAGGLRGTLALVITVAVAGKLGGATIAARLTGLGWREAAIVGSLLNTRGLLELVILNVGLDFGLLTPALFTLMVIMAIVTTFMTAPLLSLLRPRPRTQVAYEEVAHAIRRAPG